MSECICSIVVFTRFHPFTFTAKRRSTNADVADLQHAPKRPRIPRRRSLASTWNKTATESSKSLIESSSTLSSSQLFPLDHDSHSPLRSSFSSYNRVIESISSPPSIELDLHTSTSPSLPRAARSLAIVPRAYPFARTNYGAHVQNFVDSPKLVMNRCARL